MKAHFSTYDFYHWIPDYLFSFSHNYESLSIAIMIDKSVAILPFTNLSPDKDNEYFATELQRKSS